MVVIYGHERGWFAKLAERIPLAVADEVAREARYFRRQDGTKAPIDLTPLLDGGKLYRESASLAELADFAAACPRSGLGSGETESLAIVRARRVAFCTADIHAMKVMKLLNMDSHWRSLERLFKDSALDPVGLQKQWRESSWPG